jgi:adenylylsulfate kinase-like enzyme
MRGEGHEADDPARSTPTACARLSTAETRQANGPKPVSVVWLLGLSGSGKSTLAEALRGALAPIAPVAVLDGDAVRAAVGDDLGYTAEDRSIQSARLGRLARMLAMQRLIVVVADACPDPARLAWNRASLPGYKEVYLRASLAKLARRDLRGIYARARTGQKVDVVGVDIAWHEPPAPDLTLDMDDPEPPEVLALRVAFLIPEFVAAATAAAKSVPPRGSSPTRWP